jgi:hypothetical protein
MLAQSRKPRAESRRRYPLRQRRPLDEFHDERMHAVRLLEPVNRGDVGMIEGRERSGLALEARDALRVARDRVGQHLDRDLPPERRVGGAIHFAHTADANEGADFVGADPRAWSETHVREQAGL